MKILIASANKHKTVIHQKYDGMRKNKVGVQMLPTACTCTGIETGLAEKARHNRRVFETNRKSSAKRVAILMHEFDSLALMRKVASFPIF